MRTGLSVKDQALLRVVGEVLHYVWDPIRVRGLPQARDEYDGYVGPVFSMLRSGARESEIFTHLVNVAADKMGLPGRTTEAKQAASVLVSWREFLGNRA